MFQGQVLDERGYVIARLGPYNHINTLVEDLCAAVGDDWEPDFELTVWMETAE